LRTMKSWNTVNGSGIQRKCDRSPTVGSELGQDIAVDGPRLRLLWNRGSMNLNTRQARFTLTRRPLEARRRAVRVAFAGRQSGWRGPRFITGPRSHLDWSGARTLADAKEITANAHTLAGLIWKLSSPSDVAYRSSLPNTSRCSPQSAGSS
jgi:hypothetical protein